MILLPFIPLHAAVDRVLALSGMGRRSEAKAIKDKRWDASKMSANEPTWHAEKSAAKFHSPFSELTGISSRPHASRGLRDLDPAQRGPSHSVKTMRGHYGHTLNRHNGIFPIGPFS